MPHFGVYDPAQFGWTRPAEFAPFAYNGVGLAGGINQAPGYATVCRKMLDALVPHIPGGLQAGWCWGADFTDRVATSSHLFGLAFDLNAPVNPQTGSPHGYTGTHVLAADTGALVRPYGFEWGGDWSHQTPPDYMHLQCQLDSAEVIALAVTLSIDPQPPGADMSAADVAAINAHTDAQLAPLRAELAHLRQFIDGTPTQLGRNGNGMANRTIAIMQKLGMSPSI